jgi:hypothetical protein
MSEREQHPSNSPEQKPSLPEQIKSYLSQLWPSAGDPTSSDSIQKTSTPWENLRVVPRVDVGQFRSEMNSYVPPLDPAWETNSHLAQMNATTSQIYKLTEQQNSLVSQSNGLVENQNVLIQAIQQNTISMLAYAIEAKKEAEATIRLAKTNLRLGWLALVVAIISIVITILLPRLDHSSTNNTNRLIKALQDRHKEDISISKFPIGQRVPTNK